MATEALRTVRDQFSEYVERVQKTHERVVVTKNGRPAAVLMSVEDLEGLEETLEILSNPTLLAELREAEEAIDAGHVVTGVDAVRALLDQRTTPNA